MFIETIELNRCCPGSQVEISIESSALPEGKRYAVLPTKNKYFKVGTRGRGDKARAAMFRSNDAMEFIDCLVGVLTASGYDLPPCVDGKLRGPAVVRTGWWTLDLLAYAPRKRADLDVLAPDLDSEACLSPVKDALQYAGFIDDDGRIVRDTAIAVYRAGNPGLRIRLTRVGDPSQVVQELWPDVDYFGGG